MLPIDFRLRVYCPLAVPLALPTGFSLSTSSFFFFENHNRKNNSIPNLAISVFRSIQIHKSQSSPSLPLSRVLSFEAIANGSFDFGRVRTKAPRNLHSNSPISCNANCNRAGFLLASTRCLRSSIRASRAVHCLVRHSNVRCSQLNILTALRHWNLASTNSPITEFFVNHHPKPLQFALSAPEINRLMLQRWKSWIFFWA